MSKKKILKNNSAKFLFDIERVRNVLVWVNGTKTYFTTTKRAVLREAETMEIKYYISDSIFVVRRDVMVIV